MSFLGGVSRAYTSDSVYALHRIGTSADEATPLLAPYLQEMGVDRRLLDMVSSATLKDEILLVPEAQGKDWRIVYDGSGQTTFSVEEQRGKTVAVFGFSNQDHKYGGMLYCERGRRVMAIVDLDDSVHTVLRIMNGFAVEFEANGRKIPGHATYVARTEQSPPTILFLLPSLDQQSFSGSGLVLTRMTNPQLSPTAAEGGGADANRGLLDALSWGEAESAFFFRVVADNGETTLPSVFNDCR